MGNSVLTATWFGSMVIACVFWYLYRKDGKQYYALWTLSWLAITLRGIFLFASVLVAQKEPAFIIDQTIVFVSSILFLWGTTSFVSGRVVWWWSFILLITLSWLFVGPGLDFHRLVFTVPAYTFLGMAHLWTGIQVGRARDLKGIAKSGVALTFIVIGIFRCCEPWLILSSSFVTWEDWIVVTIGVVMVLGVLSIIFGRIRTESIQDAARYRLLAENAQDVIFRVQVHPATRVDFVSPSVKRLIGYSPEEIYADPEIITPMIRPDTKQKVDSEALTEDYFEQLFILNLKHRDGHTVSTEERLVPVRNRTGKIIAVEGICRNNTERAVAQKEQEKLKQQLLHSQKMEALGSLAGGVAHDMNNVLTAIMGVASVLNRRFRDDSVSERQLETILQACERGRDLTRNLLGFARKGIMHRERISLNQIVRNVVNLLLPTLSKRISLYTRPARNLPAIEGDQGQLEQALMNLCINAADAINGSGTITIITGERMLRESDFNIHLDLEPGLYVTLQVVDTGLGMDPQILERVFEPFYTTKPHGKGTGLGLSMVYGTILNHRGIVYLDSVPDSGTTVTVCLPALDIPSDSIPPGSGPYLSLNYDGEKALLVDDEEIVLRTTGELLAELGFTLYSANSGEAAYGIFKDQRSEIALVVLDLAMPGMDGRETFMKIREIEPKVPVLFATAHSQESCGNEITFDEQTGFIQKPFSIEEFAEKILELLPQ